MQVTASNFTVAEYCEQMRAGSIVVNHDYQRSDKVWPPAAKSYLIDTILLGYPVPKLALHQTTDLKTRKTKKEIVDGQQRSQAIFDFLEDRLRLSGNSQFARKTIAARSRATATIRRLQPFSRSFRQRNPGRDPTGLPSHELIYYSAESAREAPCDSSGRLQVVHRKSNGEVNGALISWSVHREAARRMTDRVYSPISSYVFCWIQERLRTSIDKFYAEHENGFPTAQEIENRLDGAMNLIMECATSMIPR